MKTAMERKLRFLQNLKLAEAADCVHDPAVQEYLCWSLSPLRRGQIAEKAAQIVEAQLAPRLLAAALQGGPTPILPEVDESTAMPIARVVSSGQIFSLNPGHCSGHGILPGTTGSGKTTALVVLADAFRDQQICVEIFARGEAGRLLLHFPGAIAVRWDQLFTNFLDPIGNPRFYNAELAPILAKGIGVHSDYVPKLLDVLMRAHSGRRAGEPALSLKQLEEIFHHLGAHGSRKCETIGNALATFNLFLGDTARVRQGPPWQDQCPVTIYNFEEAPPAYRACLSGLRQLRVQAKAAQLGHNHQLRRVIFHDEAGLEFGREFESHSGSGFVTAAKRDITQMRSRRIAILFNCQSYAQMTQDIKENTNFVCAFRTPATAEAQELGVRLNLADEQQQRLPQLPDGRAFIIAPGMPSAIEVQFPRVELGDYPPEELIAARMEPVLNQLRGQTIFSREDPIEPLDVENILGEDRPATEAAPTVNPAQSPSNAQPFQGRLLADQMAILQDVVRYPESGVADRMRRLGFGGSKGNRIKQELIDLGLLMVVEVRKSSAGGTTKLLRLTDLARTLPGLG